MQLSAYHTNHNETVTFTRQQASRFAKQVANDFNPIHDIDAKRFCVPGDLLFAVALSRIGLSHKMQVKFSDMVTDGIALKFPGGHVEHLAVTDSKNNTYLTIESQGEHTLNADKIATLTRAYVEFSGKTFPHILVPLWQQQGVMINPARPLVIYQSMSIDLSHFDFSDVSLELANTQLDVDGKRGNVRLCFTLLSQGKKIGEGEKRMVLSGLRPYQQEEVDGLVDFYNGRKHLTV